MSELGELKKVDPRAIWKHEEKDFTPWLRDNIERISKLVGITIEEVEAEKNVGDYSVDLLGRIEGTDKEVIIENQFGQTNHDHLGKLLTYMSGREATVGIWIAEEFRPEHTTTLRYLNEVSKEVSFFGIGFCVKKIGDSKPAPEFSIVVEPDKLQRTLDELQTLDEKSRLRFDFFSKLANAYLKANPKWNRVSPSKSNWMAFGSGTRGFWFDWAFKMSPWRFAVEFNIDLGEREENVGILKDFEEHRQEIEKELGFGLTFEQLPDRIQKIVHSINTDKPMTKLTEHKKDELLQWGVEKMLHFEGTLRKYIEKFAP